jgi:hypothetical protein
MSAYHEIAGEILVEANGADPQLASKVNFVDGSNTTASVNFSGSTVTVTIDSTADASWNYNPVVQSSATYTLSEDDFNTLIINTATSGVYTVPAIPSAGIADGARFLINNQGSNALTISANSGASLSGTSTVRVNDTVQIVYTVNDTTWQIQFISFSNYLTPGSSLLATGSGIGNNTNVLTPLTITTGNATTPQDIEITAGSVSSGGNNAANIVLTAGTTAGAGLQGKILLESYTQGAQSITTVGDASVNALTVGATTISGSQDAILQSAISGTGTGSAYTYHALGGGPSDPASFSGVSQTDGHYKISVSPLGGNLDLGTIFDIDPATGNAILGNAASLLTLIGTSISFNGLQSTPVSATVDLTAATPVAAYTVPTGKSFMVLYVVEIGGDAITGTPSVSIGTNAAAYNNILSPTPVTPTLASGKYASIPPAPGGTIALSEEVINILPNTLGAAGTITVQLVGILF